MRDSSRSHAFHAGKMEERMPEQQVDLGRLFGAVSTALAESRGSLNEADAYNANHGDNMVENFRIITRAVNRKKGALPAEQLAYASQVLGKRAVSGSGRMYSQGLAKAAEQLRGERAITPDNAMVLLQSLLGSQPAAQAGQTTQADPLSGMLGAMLGGGQAQGQTSQPEDPLGGLMSSLLGGASGQSQSSSIAADNQAGQPGDMLGGLLSAMMGDSSPAAQAQPAGPTGQEGGINLNTLLSAGMAFLQARQQGASTVEALVNALMAGSQMNTSPHHSQSGQLVATTLLNTISSMFAKS